MVNYHQMEKAIKKTLLYGDIFDFPMKAWEIHKWLINKKCSLRDVERGLNKLSDKKQVTSNKGYYSVGRKRLVRQRIKREEVSKRYFRQAYWVSMLFKIIPWVKLTGVSGSVAMENASASDDIDFFVITQRNRLWISRLFFLLILELIDKRRKRGEDLKKVKGKICINLILDGDSLSFKTRDVYIAHEILQMRVLWQREGVYQKYLEENSWALEMLPNWGTSEKIIQNSKLKTQNSDFKIFDVIEALAKWMQLRYMGGTEGKERIENGALFFHPQDYREKVLKDFKKKLANLS